MLRVEQVVVWRWKDLLVVAVDGPGAEVETGAGAVDGVVRVGVVEVVVAGERWAWSGRLDEVAD